MESERAGRGDVKEERGTRSGSGSVMEVTFVRVIAGEVIIEGAGSLRCGRLILKHFLHIRVLFSLDDLRRQ